MLRFRRRCLRDAVRFVGAEGGDGGSAGVGGRGPTGGGKGLIVFAGGTGDAGIGESVVGGALPLDMRRCACTGGGPCVGSSGRGGRVPDGGGFGAPIERRNVRCATAVRRDAFAVAGASSGGSAGGSAGVATGAGGSADVGAGRGGGIDIRCGTGAALGLDPTEGVCEYIVLNEFTLPADARFENVVRPDTTLFPPLPGDPPVDSGAA